MALFFGALAFVILASRVTTLSGTTPPPWLIAVEVGVLMAMPYILLRLVDDFTQLRALVKRVAEVGFVVGVIATAATVPALPPPVTLYIVGYFFVVSLYCAIAFIKASRRARGVTP